MNIIRTGRFDAFADRRLQSRLGAHGVRPGTLIPGGIGGLLDATYGTESCAGDATSKEFAGLLSGIDDAMTDVEAAKPADPLERRAPRRRSDGSVHAEHFRRTMSRQRSGEPCKGMGTVVPLKGAKKDV